MKQTETDEQEGERGGLLGGGSDDDE
jgi:hypothetical protein